MPPRRTEEVTTVWQALEAWANSLAPWQSEIIAFAVDHGKLSEADIDRVYADFLTPPAIEPVSIREAPDAAGPSTLSLRLDRIDGLRGVNALPEDAALTFGPGLTVIFGRNGVGKSGFARVLANACFSRNKPEILPNVLDATAPESCSAQFHISLGGEAQEPIPFPQEIEIDVLRRITVFDSSVAKQHVSQPTPFEFRPRGFDVFTEMARAYAELSKRLEADTQLRRPVTDFAASFIGVPTTISTTVTDISATTDIATLRALATYGDAERVRLQQLDEQLTALRAKSQKEVLATLSEAKSDTEALAARLLALADEFSSETAQQRTRLVTAADEAAASAALLGSDKFKRPFFRAVGSPEWEAFAKAAHSLGRKEDAAYPSLEDHCLLCERPLDQGSQSHMASLFAFVEGDTQKLATATQEALNSEIARLKGLQVPNFSAEARVRTHIHRLNPTTETVAEAVCAAMEATRDQEVESLVARKPVSGIVNVADACASLGALTATIDADMARLAAENIEASIASLDLERQTIRHREVLSQLLPQIETQIANLKWLANADARRGGLNTRHITDKEKDLFARLATTSYRERFTQECEALDCKLPIELQTIGRSGQTMRALSIRGGHKPDTILSEGEQKAVALADFLTEVTLNPSAAGIVLDDPVTSQDFQRKKCIADRLVVEAEKRQVIVLTHDLIFLDQLLVAAEKAGIEPLTHWIQRDAEGRPGDVALGDCPDTDKTYKTTQRAKDALARAKALTGKERATAIINGMGELRTTLEITVANRLLKETVRRWKEQIHVTALRNINWDNAKAEEICSLYEDLSRYIDAHSHSDEAAGAPPEIRDLEEKIAAVDTLITWARANRPS